MNNNIENSEELCQRLIYSLLDKGALRDVGAFAPNVYAKSNNLVTHFIGNNMMTVSYTHLTLPTNREV